MFNVHHSDEAAIVFPDCAENVISQLRKYASKSILTEVFLENRERLKMHLLTRIGTKNNIYLDDIIQEVSIVVWQKYESGQIHDMSKTGVVKFLYGVAKKFVWDSFVNPRHTYKRWLYKNIEHHEFVDELNTEEGMEQKKFQFLNEAISILPDEEKTLILIYLGAGCNQEEVRHKTGLTSKKLNVKLKALIRKMRAEVKDYDLKELMVLGQIMKERELNSMKSKALELMNLNQALSYGLSIKYFKRKKQTSTSVNVYINQVVEIADNLKIDKPFTQFTVLDYENIIMQIMAAPKAMATKKSIMNFVNSLIQQLVDRQLIHLNLFSQAMRAHFNSGKYTRVEKDVVPNITLWFQQGLEREEINRKLQLLYNASRKQVNQWILFAIHMLKAEGFVFSDVQKTALQLANDRVEMMERWIRQGVYSEADRTSIIAKARKEFCVDRHTAWLYTKKVYKKLNLDYPTASNAITGHQDGIASA